MRAENGGHRALSPDQLLKRYGHLVSPITGIVPVLEPSPGAPEFATTYVSGRNLAMRDGGLAGLRVAADKRGLLVGMAMLGLLPAGIATPLIAVQVLNAAAVTVSRSTAAASRPTAGSSIRASPHAGRPNRDTRHPFTASPRAGTRRRFRRAAAAASAADES